MGSVEVPTAEAMARDPLRRVSRQEENPFASLIPDQTIAIVPSFTLESGQTLTNVPVAYTTRGKLSPTGDNAMVICHALSGSADVADWWGPLLGGPGKAFDVSRFYIVCLNSLGSPYGTASPVTNIDGDPSKGRYGPEFPLTTIRDDVNLHRIVLEDLGIRQIAAVVGGSMGGMQVLEWAYFGPDYVRAIVPIATSSQHSAWGISWGEAQRQCIYSDPKYLDGYYSFDDPPSTGLSAARMQALLTYRSRNSFESRFGRNVPSPRQATKLAGRGNQQRPMTPPASSDNFSIHNEGHRVSIGSRPGSWGNGVPLPPGVDEASLLQSLAADPQFHGTSTTSPLPPTPPTPQQQQQQQSEHPSLKRTMTPTYFSAQSYLRYQGQKFVARFDSNCYISITRKLDTHDVSLHNSDTYNNSNSHSHFHSGNSNHNPPSGSGDVAAALALIRQPALVIGIESDGLFTFAEQEFIAANIPHARLRTIDSPEGHDAFLLQFEQVNRHILEFFGHVLPDVMAAAPATVAAGHAPEQDSSTIAANKTHGEATDMGVGKESLFGEAEVGDMTEW